MKRLGRLICILTALTCAGCSQIWPSGVRIGQIQNEADGIIIPVGVQFLKVQVCSDDVVRIVRAKDQAFFSHHSLATEAMKAQSTNWKIEKTSQSIAVVTSKLKAQVDLRNGAVTFLNAKGETILAENDHQITPAQVQGEHTFHVSQQWKPNGDESLYGLGQQQLGILDIKGYDLDLWQHNTNVVVPFLLSSRGYGVLWDNISYSRFGDTREFETIPAESMVDADGKAGGLTSATFTTGSPDRLQNPSDTIDLTRPATGRGGRGNRTPTNYRWFGQIKAPTTGDYQFRTYSNGGIKVWINDQLLINHWRQNWLADNDQVKVHLEAGHLYPIKIESGGDQTSTMQLLWKIPPPSNDTSLWSEVGDGIDYYFVYGPQLDQVVAGYRNITGQASLLPKWAFGLWQSRQRYETAQQLTDALDGFRDRLIPIDNIVQDWMYWPQSEWGSHRFDPERFPNPEAWIKSIHDKHARLMISVWGKFYPTGDNFKAMQEAGYIYQPTLDANLKDWVGRGYSYTFYDAFNPNAGKLFWDQINAALFSKGVDAWWMDATEPDVVQPSPPTLELTKKYIGKTAMGSASRVLNAYALYNSKAIYDGQRSVAPDQRVFILTRSGFAGEQRFGTVTWSGDTTSTWTALAKQISAGLGFSISGVPWWTMDVGGYTMDSRFSAKPQAAENAEEWRELNVRWFQFGTFCPILRVHGEIQPREMWTLGGETHPAYQTELKFDKLRYAMLPYLYSVAGDVTHNGGTMMKPLVMDFTSDAAARSIIDEYMFGPAFLVAPVTAYKARSRSVYLPNGTDWYDFWNGKSGLGGQKLDAPAPYDSMPLYIRAGSIIPFGPELQYTDEKPADPITLYVYSGADSHFNLYEDEGVNYNYEKGAFSQIPIQWDETNKTLKIGARTGSFPNMLNERTFQIVIVSKSKPVGYSPAPTIDKTINYDGRMIEVKFQE